MSAGKLLGMAGFILAAGLAAYAGPYVPQGPFVIPLAGDILPGPTEVPGKEYSDNPDKNAAAAADPMQVIMWDGVGGVADTFDYDELGGLTGQVDALANVKDALFFEVIADNAYLLFSVTGDGNIYWEKPKAMVSGIWATPAQIDQHGVNDVDGLEVWGPEQMDDANKYSMAGDPVANGVATSVFNLGGSTYITRAQIAGAIAPLKGLEQEDIVNGIDLDALMVFDGNTEGPALNTFTYSGDWVMFSIAPIAGVFDGGEIFVWNYDGGNAPASYLWHGGHLWDTAFQVAATYGLNSENINALEAVSTALVPEPAVFGLLAAAAATLAVRRRTG